MMSLKQVTHGFLARLIQRLGPRALHSLPAGDALRHDSLDPRDAYRYVWVEDVVYELVYGICESINNILLRWGFRFRLITESFQQRLARLLLPTAERVLARFIRSMEKHVLR